MMITSSAHVQLTFIAFFPFQSLCIAVCCDGGLICKEVFLSHSEQSGPRAPHCIMYTDFLQSQHICMHVYCYNELSIAFLFVFKELIDPDL